jgi:hypothetical protein
MIKFLRKIIKAKNKNLMTFLKKEDGDDETNTELMISSKSYEFIHLYNMIIIH